MKAMVQERFGSPDSLRFMDAERPAVGPDDVLIRVHAAALNPADWHILRGDPLVARLMGIGLTKPKARIAGTDAAGVVEAVGSNVRDMQPGDEVLGFCRGAFAEHASAKADLVVPKPAHDAQYWARATEGMDFTSEDRFDFARYNRILWNGLMGNKPYPAAPTGIDLRQDREELLARYRRSLEQEAVQEPGND